MFNSSWNADWYFIINFLILKLTNGFEVDTNGEFFADVIGGCDEGY
jgi:hypothetical protein